MLRGPQGHIEADTEGKRLRERLCMAAGRRRKVGAVRQIGGRIAPEHRNAVMSQVVASRFPCPVCGSGKLRVTTSGQEGEVCRQTREQRRRRRTVLRRTAAGRTVSWLVRQRSREAGLMLSRYAAWQALGPDPLPQGRKALDRLRVHLDAVHVLDTELKRRYTARASAGPVGMTERQAAVLASDRRPPARTGGGHRGGRTGKPPADPALRSTHSAGGDSGTGCMDGEGVS
ncbi:hypothetical protein ACWDY4_24410 [Streptomyces olivaceoviridis]